MSTPGPLATPEGSYNTPRRQKIVLWKWSAGLAGAVLIYLMWQCGSGLSQGRTLSNEAVRHFHQQLNGAQYQEISNEASDAFHSSDKESQLLRFLQVVHTKLGDAGTESLSNIRVNATTSGTFITTVYTTAFVRGQAEETFTWIKSGGRLKLYAYHVDSNALVMN
jgi:hypothetical protein